MNCCCSCWRCCCCCFPGSSLFLKTCPPDSEVLVVVGLERGRSMALLMTAHQHAGGASAVTVTTKYSPPSLQLPRLLSPLIHIRRSLIRSQINSVRIYSSIQMVLWPWFKLLSCWLNCFDNKKYFTPDQWYQNNDNKTWNNKISKNRKDRSCAEPSCTKLLPQ